jgi:hypothetical protein
MPLTPLQRDIARLIAVNRTPGSHLAGGAALHMAAHSLRTSNALDYFHDSEVWVGQAFAADRALLEGAGFHVEVSLSQPGFVRAVVGRSGDETKVEWAHDSAWRFLPAVRDPDVGYVLHPLDLAINKVLALAGRDEPRDFLDVVFVHEHYLPLAGLCWAAVGKDPGYGASMLVEMLARKGRYRPDDFAPLQLTSPLDLPALKLSWLAAVEGAREAVRTLPPGDSGCLYLNPATGKFQVPVAGERLVRHFGSRGGILPRVDEGVLLQDNPANQRVLAAPVKPSRAVRRRPAP